MLRNCLCQLLCCSCPPSECCRSHDKRQIQDPSANEQPSSHSVCSAASGALVTVHTAPRLLQKRPAVADSALWRDGDTYYDAQSEVASSSHSGEEEEAAAAALSSQYDDAPFAFAVASTASAPGEDVAAPPVAASAAAGADKEDDAGKSKEACCALPSNYCASSLLRKRDAQSVAVKDLFIIVDSRGPAPRFY